MAEERVGGKREETSRGTRGRKEEVEKGKRGYTREEGGRREEESEMKSQRGDSECSISGDGVSQVYGKVAGWRVHTITAACTQFQRLHWDQSTMHGMGGMIIR